MEFPRCILSDIIISMLYFITISIAAYNVKICLDFKNMIASFSQLLQFKDLNKIYNIHLK